jgi:nicotinate-nucleotide pyrophosphorylase (carboxylating)
MTKQETPAGHEVAPWGLGRVPLYTNPDVSAVIDRAIQEDLALGDATTDALVPRDLPGEAVIFAKSPGVLCGVDVALEVFRRIDPSMGTEALLADGAAMERGSNIARLKGSKASILMGERLALNFLQHLSGVATATALYVKTVEGTRARIIDTRKTIPGLRALQKYAVRAGGGRNHRQNLGDGILIKDNHIAALRAQGMSLADTVRLAEQRASHTIKIEVEVTSLEEVQEALDGGAHLILLDNMSVEQMREAVQLVDGRAMLEASGGITLESVRAIAETGVDLISSGALTHSTRALDISLDFV